MQKDDYDEDVYAYSDHRADYQVKDLPRRAIDWVVGKSRRVSVTKRGLQNGKKGTELYYCFFNPSISVSSCKNVVVSCNTQPNKFYPDMDVAQIGGT